MNTATILKAYAKHPWKLWIMLQAGGFTAWVIGATMAVWVINHVLAKFIVAYLGVSVQAVRGCVFLTCGLAIVSSHLLWREMIRTYQAKCRRAYVKHGKHATLFANDKSALAARETYLETMATKRRLKNRQSRGVTHRDFAKSVPKGNTACRYVGKTQSLGDVTRPDKKLPCAAAAAAAAAAGDD